MSNQFTSQQIQAQFDSLPEDIKQVVSSSETATQIEDIGRKHDLRIDAIGVLIEYSTLIMLGLIKSNEFVSELAKRLSISNEQAEAIAVEIDSQVFSRIRNSLREVQYRPGTTSRFEETDTIVDTTPRAKAADSPQETPSPEALQSDMSTQNYTSEAFAGKAQSAASAPTQPTPTPPANEEASETSPQQEEAQAPDTDQAAGAAPKATPASTLDRFQETGFDENTETNIPLRNSAPAQHTRTLNADDAPLADSEQKEQEPAAHASSQQAATPAPDASAQDIKDFRTRLEERMASADNTQVNSDPYKESI